MTTYVIPGGDLLKAAKSFNLINAFAHGANCWSNMGAGIAKFVAMEFPGLARADEQDPRGPEQRLGNMSYAFDNGVWGFNLYTQFYPGPNARRPSIISSVQLMLEQVHSIVEAKQDEVVYLGLPAIGCGIGGQRFNEVAVVIHELANALYEDTRRRVVPVFYVLEADVFKQEIQDISTYPGIVVVSCEGDILEEEGIE